MRRLQTLFTAVVVSLTVSTPALASYRDTVLADAPEAYWRLGETAGSVAADSSGHGHDATSSGLTLGQPGAIVQDPDPSVYMDAAGLVRGDSAGLLPNLDSWSVEAWVKVPATGALMEIVSWYPGGYLWGHNSAYILAITAQGQPIYQLGDVSGNMLAVTGAASIADSAWHHLVGVLDRQGGRARLYVDGTEAASVPVGVMGLIAESGIPVNIGRQYRYWMAPTQFQGMLDEVALYRGALGAERVRLHNDTGRGLLSDADADGVADGNDRCPDTPLGATVDAGGCITACPAASPDAADIDAAVQSALAAQYLVIAEKDALVAQKEATIASLNADSNLCTAALAARDETIASLQSELAALTASLAEKEAAVAALNASLATLTSALAEKDQALGQLQQQVAALTAGTASLSSTIAARDETIAVLSAQKAAMYSSQQLDQAVMGGKASAEEALLALLVRNLRQVFGDPGFVLQGGSGAGAVSHLTGAIAGMPAGQIKKLHDLLTP